jgi:general secretion pathway protein K
MPAARDRGSVLLYVVWAILLLSLFAASVGSHAITALNVTERLSDRLRAAGAARSAAEFAWLAVDGDESPEVDGMRESWSDSAAFLDHALAGGTFSILNPDARAGRRYGLMDEDRRLNLNTAPGDVLQRLFELAGGLTEHDAEALSEAVQDWRDEDDRERSHGAEGIYYRSRSGGYDCKDGPFENLEELLLVRGVTPALFAKLEPYLTVYGSGRLNLNTAEPMALSALGLSRLGVEGLLALRAGEDGVEGTFDDRRLVAGSGIDDIAHQFLPAADVARLSELAQAQAIGVKAEAFRMHIEAHAQHPDQVVRVLCVMDRKGVVKLWTDL